MGWLEILPLLKRLLPLLTRIAPMLEGYVAARGAGRPDSEAALQRLSEQWSAHGEALERNGVTLQETLAEQGHAVLRIAADLASLRQADEANRSKLLALEQEARSTARLVKTLQIVSVVSLFVLLICTGLLIALYVTRR